MYDPKTIDEVTITDSKERYYGDNVQEVYRAAVGEYVHRFSVCLPLQMRIGSPVLCERFN